MQDTHFLRPTLTKDIIEKLQKGDSLNLYGDPGTGKTRLLEDIQNANLHNILIISVSFKGCQNSYNNFCDMIWKSANKKGKTPDNLSGIIEKMQESNKQIFLFIDDFDYLFENQELDQKYDLKFIDSLNAIRNTSGVSLLVVTKKPVNDQIIIINQKPYTSTLNMKPEEITKVYFLDIQAELNRLFKGVLQDKEIVELVEHLEKHVNSYAILMYYKLKILGKEDGQLNFQDRLKKWLAMFEQRKHESLMKRADKSLDKLEGWTLFFKRLRKLLIPFESVFNVLKKASGDVFLWIISLFKKGN